MAMPTRWYNPNLPQTLVISQFLLYFDAFWALLGVLSGQNLGLLGIIVLAGYVYGAAGIASGLKWGWRVAVAVSFLPLVLRALIALGSVGGLLDNLGFVFLGDNVLNVIFEYALIALLLHPQSREHQKLWFD
jgi:hypothetical protein